MANNFKHKEANRARELPEQRDRAEVERPPGKAAGSGTRAAKARNPGTSHGGRRNGPELRRERPIFTFLGVLS